jgi:hypothetical protein
MVSGAKRKRYVIEEVAALLDAAFATVLAKVGGTVRRMALGEEAEGALVDAVCRAHELHRAKVLGLANEEESALADLRPSKAVALGMARILCPDNLPHREEP